MNLRLNAALKYEIEGRLRYFGFDREDFEFTKRLSVCVFKHVQHAYRVLDHDEPTEAEAIVYRAHPDYYFTFERDHRGNFLSTSFPENVKGSTLQAREWVGIIDALSIWLNLLKLEKESRTLGPVRTRTFDDMVNSRDFTQIRREFERAERNCSSDPAAAVTAASSMVEATCKLYISDKQLDLPATPTIKPLWNVVAKRLLPANRSVADEDVHRLASGIASVVDGLGSLRTHTSTAHGRSPDEPKAGQAEALLAIHAAQALVIYVLHKWKK